MTKDKKLLFLTVTHCCLHGQPRWPWTVSRRPQHGLLARSEKRTRFLVRHKHRRVCRIEWLDDYRNASWRLDIYSLPLLKEFVREFGADSVIGRLSRGLWMLEAAWSRE